MEFGATYPFEDKTPYRATSNALGRSKGKFGIPLKSMTREEKFNNSPNYVKKNQLYKETEEPIPFPNWKKNYIRSNRAFYERYKVE